MLKCINNISKRFHTFESNRLIVMHNGSKPSEWKYMNRDDKPTDDGSKGPKIDVMLKNVECHAEERYQDPVGGREPLAENDSNCSFRR